MKQQDLHKESVSYEKKGDIKKALASASKAANLAETQATNQNLLVSSNPDRKQHGANVGRRQLRVAVLALRLDDNKKAVAAADRAVELLPDSGQARFRQAQAFARLDEKSKAISAAKKARNMGAGNKAADALIKRLESSATA